jgi:hypothetical protein
MPSEGATFRDTSNNTIMKLSATGNIGFFTDEPLASVDISSQYFTIIPKGTTSQRPTNAENITGCMRYNTTLGILEGYRGGSSSGWWPLYNQCSDDTRTRISFDDGFDNSYNIHFYTDASKCMTLTEDGSLCIGVTTGDKKINVEGTTTCDKLYYNGTEFITIADYVYDDLSINDNYSSRNSTYTSIHTVDVSENLNVFGTPTIKTSAYVNNTYNDTYSVKIGGDFEASRLEITDISYNGSLSVGDSSNTLPYSKDGDVRVHTNSKNFEVYNNGGWRISKSLQRPFMAIDCCMNNTILTNSNALYDLSRVNLSGGKFITNDTTTFDCNGSSNTDSRILINQSGVYLLTIGVVFSGDNSSNTFRYVLFKSDYASNVSTDTNSINYYANTDISYVFDDTGLSTGPLWANVDNTTSSKVTNANYYDQVQDFGDMSGSGLTEKTIPFVLETGKSITMFAAYRGSFEKLYLRFLRLGPLDSIINGSTTTIQGINSTLLFSDLITFSGGIDSDSTYNTSYNSSNYQSNNSNAYVTYGSKDAYTTLNGKTIDHPNGSNGSGYGGWWSDTNFTYRSVRLGAGCTMTSNVDWLGVDGANTGDGDLAIEFCFVGGGGGGGGHYSDHGYTNHSVMQGGGGGGGTMVTRNLNINSGTYAITVGSGGNSGGGGARGGRGG